MMIILAKMLFDDDENDADRLQRAFQLPRVIMWGLSLYCCVRYKCYTTEQRLIYTDKQLLSRYALLQALVMPW